MELLNNRRFVSAIATPLAGSESTGVLLTLHDLTQLRQIETTRREFVSNVSHELRTPLSSVKALAEALENGALEDSDTARDFVRRIHGEADRMSALVEELLELSRLESGQAALQMATVDVAALASTEIEAFQLRAEAAGAVLVARLPDAPALVRGERDKLRQVLVNLLDNALKFTPSGGTVTVLVHAAAGGVEVSVRDTGAGIPAEHVPHVFERFYKVDRARRDGGTGLGLAIVRHIVEAHGGTARVESREGEGTTVSVILRARCRGGIASSCLRPMAAARPSRAHPPASDCTSSNWRRPPERLPAPERGGHPTGLPLMEMPSPNSGSERRGAFPTITVCSRTPSCVNRLFQGTRSGRVGGEERVTGGAYCICPMPDPVDREDRSPCAAILARIYVGQSPPLVRHARCHKGYQPTHAHQCVHSPGFWPGGLTRRGCGDLWRALTGR